MWGRKKTFTTVLIDFCVEIISHWFSIPMTEINRIETNYDNFQLDFCINFNASLFTCITALLHYSFCIESRLDLTAFNRFSSEFFSLFEKYATMLRHSIALPCTYYVFVGSMICVVAMRIYMSSINSHHFAHHRILFVQNNSHFIFIFHSFAVCRCGDGFFPFSYSICTARKPGVHLSLYSCHSILLWRITNIH